MQATAGRFSAMDASREHVQLAEFHRAAQYYNAPVTIRPEPQSIKVAGARRELPVRRMVPSIGGGVTNAARKVNRYLHNQRDHKSPNRPARRINDFLLNSRAMSNGRGSNAQSRTSVVHETPGPDLNQKYFEITVKGTNEWQKQPSRNKLAQNPYASTG